jgi:hypothetical protein
VQAANKRIDDAQRGWDAWYAKALAIERRTMQRVEAEFERANRAGMWSAGGGGLLRECDCVCDYPCRRISRPFSLQNSVLFCVFLA